MSSLKRTGCLSYFIDALGAEYLPYIIEKCRDKNIYIDVKMARCVLPSITKVNKDFLEIFPDTVKISELDDIKHASSKFDYERCKLPLYIFSELSAIDRVLDTIKSKLAANSCKTAYVFSDHGASRLAVIAESESQSLIEMQEKGIHSGRCCETNEEPRIDFACWEGGYAVIANYDRFKGGRKADVEVHGGASLEEVIVPVLELSVDKIAPDIRVIAEPMIEKGKPIVLELFCGIEVKEPLLLLGNSEIRGEHTENRHNVRFKFAEGEKQGEQIAMLFDGWDRASREIVADHVQFVIKKKRLAEENDMFDF